MTLDEYLNKNPSPLNFYTVKELYDDLKTLIDEGKGDRIVMVETSDHNRIGDYVFLNRATSCERGITDTLGQVVYLDIFNQDDDEYLAQQIFKD